MEIVHNRECLPRGPKLKNTEFLKNTTNTFVMPGRSGRKETNSSEANTRKLQCGEIKQNPELLLASY